MSLKRLSAAVLLLFIMVSGLWAQTFFITDYIYKIDGKTSEAVMDSMMGETSRFESEDELKAYLELRKQELWNTNLFSKVDVKYTIDFSVDTNSFVTVNIEVDEAASSLFFPYPKYDSNYGFVMGLRYKERNLLGMMATLDASLDIKQQERSFKKGSYYYDIPIGGIKIGGATINAEPFGEFDFLNREKSYFGLNFDETGWKLGSATIATTVESKFYYNDMKQSKVTFSFSESGLEIGPGKLKSGITVVIKPKNVPVLDTFNFNLTYSDVPVGNNGAKLAFSTTNELYPKDTAMWFTYKSFN